MFTKNECLSANIYVEGQGVVRCKMLCRDGKILSFGEYDERTALPERLIVLPGFIDKHIHGAGGTDCMRDENALRVMSARLAEEGVTRFLPTTMTAPARDVEAALSRMGRQIEYDRFDGALPIGIHLEGPFIHPSRAGAQPVEDILPFSEELFDRWNEISHRRIRQVTYAPERNPGMTKALTKRGIVPSVGHTMATAADVLTAERDGALSATHVFNAMTPLSHRACGTVGGVMLSDTLFCELICDGKHVEKEAVRVLYKTAKGRITLVTDATEAKGLPAGKYHLGKNPIVVRDDLARLEDGTIAGSVLKMNDAVRNFSEFCGVKIEEAVDAASLLPAKCLRIDDVCGSIALGKVADFVVCDEKVNVFQTIRNGKTIYQKQL